MAAIRFWWLFCWLSPLSSAHSIKPAEAEATNTAASGCFVRLLRRTSKSTPCFPEDDSSFATKSGGRYGCVDNSTVTVARHCAGLFACGNGYTTLCPLRNKPNDQWSFTCQCQSPCHENPYMQRDLKAKGLSCGPMVPPSPLLPPLPPVPPQPPSPLSPAQASSLDPSDSKPAGGPADVAGCEPWCSKREGKAKICKCAACAEEDAPLAVGAPCHHGHAPANSAVPLQGAI